MTVKKGINRRSVLAIALSLLVAMAIVGLSNVHAQQQQVQQQQKVVISLNGYTSIPVEKVWVDENGNPASPEKDSVCLWLWKTNNYGAPEDRLLIDAAGGWKGEFRDLYPGDYYVEEHLTRDDTYPVSDWDVRYQTSGPNGVKVTNSPKVTSIPSLPVKKTWAGNGPKSAVNVTLKGPNGFSKTVTLDSGNDWKYVFTDLPGKKSDYSFDENTVPSNYKKTINNNYTSGPWEGFEVTNTYNPPKTTTISVKKVWDSSEVDPPQNLTVYLWKAGYGYYKTATLNAGNNWTYTWNDLPEGTYRAYEQVPDGWEQLSTSPFGWISEGTFTLTNKPKTMSIPVRKN